MKTPITIVILLIHTTCFSQESTVYSDSINKFSIALPRGWTIVENKNMDPSVKLLVKRQKLSEADTAKEALALTMIPVKTEDLNSTYADMLDNIGKRAGFNLIEEGDTTQGDNIYKWVIEDHDNNVTHEHMTAYILLGYKSKTAYMLTISTYQRFFSKFKNQFKRIAGTVRL